MDPIEKEVIKVVKVLADISRFKVLLWLRDGEMDTKTIQDRLKKSKSTISQHLKLLSNANLIQYRKEERRKIYSLKDPQVDRILFNITTYIFNKQKKKLKSLTDFDQETTSF